MNKLINRHRDASFGFKFALDCLVHALGKAAGNPDLPALATGLDRDVLKEIKMSFNKPVKPNLLPAQSSAALRAQGIFHRLYSLPSGFGIQPFVRIQPMDSNNMDKVTQRAENIKRFAAHVTQDKATGIRRIFGVGLNGLALINRLFNFRQRYITSIATALSVPGNQEFTSIKFLPDSFNHYDKFITGDGFCQEDRNRVKIEPTPILLRGSGVSSGRLNVRYTEDEPKVEVKNE